jgi:hypothetical protein
MSRIVTVFLLLFSSLLFSCSKKIEPAKRHYPLQNPQGMDFEADSEFAKSYHKYLVNKAKQDNKLIGTKNFNSQSSVRIYDLQGTDNLKTIDPKAAGWEVDYIPPPKTKTEEVVEYVKNKTTSTVKNIKGKIDSKKNNKSKNIKKANSAKKTTSRRKDLLLATTVKRKPCNKAVNSKKNTKCNKEFKFLAKGTPTKNKQTVLKKSGPIHLNSADIFNKKR